MNLISIIVRSSCPFRTDSDVYRGTIVCIVIGTVDEPFHSLANFFHVIGMFICLLYNDFQQTLGCCRSHEYQGIITTALNPFPIYLYVYVYIYIISLLAYGMFIYLCHKSRFSFQYD